METTAQFEALFEALGDDECRSLLRQGAVGRVVWSAGDGLEALPVCYRMSGQDIFFAADPESVLGELARPTAVAFQIDDIDVDTQTGWSVLVRGRARRWDGADASAPPRPWAPGERPLVVVVEPQTYTGRVVAGA
ncbi:MAG: pyridoxamine 5'-phosphate oxidase family protein [Propionibacteriaceae bacterium]|nr:pyridoxamine 5'-phosphate oxidase family protein [Propionibacteriaceae bacterium]